MTNVVKTFTFQSCWVHVDGNYTETVFQDGTKVTAVPEDSDEYRAKAARYGYGDQVAALSREHEILHTFLAERLWNHASHALWGVAHGGETGEIEGVTAPLWVQEWEETLVLAFQVFLNGVDGEEIQAALQPIHDAGLTPEELRDEAIALLRE